jgi:hypothetical protein
MQQEVHTARIDITRAANAARHLYVATFILGWLWALVSLIILFSIQTLLEIDSDTASLSGRWASHYALPLLLISCFGVYSNFYARRLHKWAYRVFIFETLALVGLVCTTIGLISASLIRGSFEIYDGLAIFIAGLIYPTLALISSLRLFWVKYDALQTTPLKLVDAVARYTRHHRSPVPRLHWPNRPVVATLWGILVIVSYLLSIGLSRATHIPFVFLILPIFFAALFRRSYMLPADKVLALDLRRPVVFLRSFAADRVRLWGKAVMGKMRGKTIDEAIAPLANTVGPFVAIANPKSKLPTLGAAKSYYADDTWQSAISRWVTMAQMIVMVAGRTDGIKWEVAHIFENNAHTKLVILVPSSKRSQVAVDEIWFQDTFGGSPYAAALTNLSLQRTIAVILREDNILSIETGRTRRSAVDYWMALQVAIYVSIVQPKMLYD